ncbi:ADP-ribosylglycohydrolase family protein [bacterium]|nr:ADP-ribosylglycohydrolase family protein [bacterium]
MFVPREEHFIGCLIGECLGDALGFPVEGAAPAECQQYVEEILKGGRAGEQGRGGGPFGQYTDDSQLARELLQSYAACKEFDPEDYAGRIAAIFREGRVVGEGIATAKAARRLARGVHWEEAGALPPSAGNGSAMRAGPVGLLFFDDPEQLIRVAHDQGRITHRDRRCSAGAVAIAGAVALVLQNESIGTQKFLSELSTWSARIEHSVATAIQELIEWVQLPPEQAVIFISRSGSPDYSDGWQGISPFVTSSVLWSLYSFLRSPGDYWETICTAIAVGGDVDTTAAMAGAISGAYLGLEAIPSDLSHRLTDRGTWGYAELVGLARKCYELKVRQREDRKQ